MSGIKKVGGLTLQDLQARLQGKGRDAVDPETRVLASVDGFALGAEKLGERTLARFTAGTHGGVLFPPAVLQEAANLPSLSDEYARRPRVQGVCMTIDDSKAVRLEDGLSVRRKAGGEWVVGVHVIDVGAWIRRGSHLDHAARLRGRQVIASGGVWPMFPTPVTRELFNLLPGQPRLCQTLEMTFTEDGTLLEHQWFKSVFCSAHRLTGLTPSNKVLEDSDLARVMPGLARIASKVAGQSRSVGQLEAINDAFVTLSGRVLGLELHTHGVGALVHHAPPRSAYGLRANGAGNPWVQWTSPARRYNDLDVHRSLEQLYRPRAVSPQIAAYQRMLRERQRARENRQRKSSGLGGGLPGVRKASAKLQGILKAHRRAAARAKASLRRQRGKEEMARQGPPALRFRRLP